MYFSLPKRFPLKRKPNQQNTIKDTATRDGFQPTAIVAKEGERKIARAIGAYAEVKRQHDPEIKQPRNIRSKHMLAHVTDLQETMHAQYRQYGNAANDEKILPIEDTADKGKSKEKRKHKLEVFAFLGIRLPKVQEKPQMRDGEYPQSQAFVAQNFQDIFAPFLV